MKKYNVCVVGAGMVGKKMVEILIERNFPLKNLKILATKERQEEINGRVFEIEETTIEKFEGVDIAFFAGTEGEKGASKLFGWYAVEKGCIVIDNGADFRMDDRVPLVVPEVNSHALRKHQGFISNPNCSTIQMVVALYPLHLEFGLKRIIVSTYQAVSGTGKKAVEELEKQVENYVKREKIENQVYPYQIFGNLIPEIGSLSDEFYGYYTEEVKMIKETRKIMELPDLLISATTVRVPVFNGHSESITAQFEKNPDIKKAREILEKSPGIKVIDQPEKSLYPTPLLASGKDEVFVGRIRKNPALENSLDLWVVADNIRKGAALNAIQIAEKMIEMKLI
ncbi:MAG: aspartate-semialdehyde dehydrogenase [Candidatus Omnitrophica bacterium]|nr:aspartate-semialdehyde dehydrogenase [Candidatus Omnitrophota bacterium]MCM8809082.1 aspartate-semialdehyde dehydrogenase [Candidatus Omnitrophota bacterium]MCM8811307.1 aspartate-semialdehyde dehydrogenase [Candidatus Omnitrophota bacterium]